MELVPGEFAVAVLVEFLQSRRRVGDLFRRKFAVVVGVEHLHERIARRFLPPAAAFGVAIGRALALVIVIIPRRTFGRLGDDNGRAQRAAHSDDPKHATHGHFSRVFRRKPARVAHFRAATQLKARFDRKNNPSLLTKTATAASHAAALDVRL
jgi:hypothetical protein